MAELVIAVDLGMMHAYEIVRDPLKIASDRLDAVTSRASAELREASRGAKGRFYQGGGTGGTTTGFGEEHRAALEAEKRLVRRIAGDINSLIAEKDCDKWYLAAERSINNQLLEFLLPEVKAKLKKNVAANLTKTDKSKIMEHFV